MLVPKGFAVHVRVHNFLDIPLVGSKWWYLESFTEFLEVRVRIFHCEVTINKIKVRKYARRCNKLRYKRKKIRYYFESWFFLVHVLPDVVIRNVG